MIKYLRSIVLILLFTLYSFGSIEGVAFKDYDLDGVKEAGEPGVEGVIVKAYLNDSSGTDQLLTQTTTGPNGKYRLSIPANKFPVRLEFEIPASTCSVKKGVEYPATQSFIKSNSRTGSNIQFVQNDGEVHDFAIN